MFDPSLDSTWATDKNPTSTTPVEVIEANAAARICPLTIVIANNHATDACTVTLCDGTTDRISVRLVAGASCVIEPKGWKITKGAALNAKLAAAGSALVSVEYTTTTG